jgi:hypothetical protein
VAQPYMFSCLYDTGTVLFHGKYYSNVLFFHRLLKYV